MAIVAHPRPLPTRTTHQLICVQRVIISAALRRIARLAGLAMSSRRGTDPCARAPQLPLPSRLTQPAHAHTHRILQQWARQPCRTTDAPPASTASVASDCHTRPAYAPVLEMRQPASGFGWNGVQGQCPLCDLQNLIASVVE
jgi:hypothetical protein